MLSVAYTVGALVLTVGAVGFFVGKPRLNRRPRITIDSALGDLN